MSAGAGTVARSLSVLIALFVVWQILATVANDPVFWPTFTDVASRLWETWL